MLKRLGVALFLLMLSMLSRAQITPLYYGLAGVIQSPLGGGFNGTLSVMLARSTAMNTCSSPALIVTQQPVTFQVVNGAIIGGSSAQFITNTCLTPSVPYFAQLFDTNKKRVYADNWFFPQMSGSTVDVGTIMDVGFGTLNSTTISMTGTQSTSTPVVVAIPSAIVGTPAGAQTVTQPGGTFLTVNNLSVTGTFTASNALSASITGNAATATALAATPSQCSSGFYAQGIAANGNANCSNAFPSNSSFGSLQITGAVNSYSSQGAYLNWNASGGGGLGEVDFVNNRGGGSGGWWWVVAGFPTTAIASLTEAGNFTTTSFTGNLTGAVTGNASTASALASTPSQCSTGQFSTGIAANGNANCSAPTGGRTCNSNGCYVIYADGTIEQWSTPTTAPSYGGAVNGTTTITFPHSFTTTNNLSVVASPSACNGTGGACGSGIHPNTLTPQYSTLTTGGITVYYDGNGSTVQTSTVIWRAIGN